MKYGVLVNKQINIPGDERSRTNPGHGYPAYTLKYMEFEEFDTEAELLAWVESKNAWVAGKDYRVLHFEELEVVIQRSVHLHTVVKEEE